MIKHYQRRSAYPLFTGTVFVIAALGGLLGPVQAKDAPAQTSRTREAAVSQPYEPAVVTLSGTIVKERFGDDASPLDRGKSAWILRLDHRITVSAKPGDQIDTEEKNVTEVHLNIDPKKQQIPRNAFGKTTFAVTGTLYHAHTAHHLRPIVMLVSTIAPVTTKAKSN